jgi:hypothetical protein
MPRCPHCSGTGFRFIERIVRGYEKPCTFAARCTCKNGKITAAPTTDHKALAAGEREAA